MKEDNVSVKDNGKEIAGELAKILADEYVLCNKTRYAQSHIGTLDSFRIHKAFKMQFERLENFISRIAKHIGLFGHYSPPASPSFLEIAHIKDNESTKKDFKGFLKELMTDHKTLIKNLRAHILHFPHKYQDIETGNFFAELKADHEKLVGLLQSHL